MSGAPLGFRHGDPCSVCMPPPGAQIAVVNLGETRADDLADLKVEALAGETMMKLATHPDLLIPRI